MRGSGPPFGPFQLADANDDNKVTKDELLALFTKIDSNKDGAVTHPELFTGMAVRIAGKSAEGKEPKADQPAPGRGRGMMRGFGPMRRGGMRMAPERPRRPEGKSANPESKPAKPADQPKPEKKEADGPKQQQPQQPEKEAKPAAEETPKQAVNEASPVAVPVAETITAVREAVLAEKP